MNKSVKYFALSLLLATSIAHAGGDDDTSWSAYLLDVATSGSRQFATGFSGGVAGGVAAAAGEESLNYSNLTGRAQNLARGAVYTVASFEALRAAEGIAASRLNLPETPANTYPELIALYAGRGVGWVTGNVVLGSLVKLCKKQQ